MKIIIFYINDNGNILANKLSRYFVDSIVYDFKNNEQLLMYCFENKINIIFIAATGIVVRLISPYIKNKYVDPAVVCVDTAGRYAISLLSGHEGGANKLAYCVAVAIGAEPIITTGTESHKKITIGIGCRREIDKKQILNAVYIALDKIKTSIDMVRCVASVDIKKNEAGLLSACDELSLPLVFFQKKDINNIKELFGSSEIVKRNIGVDGVCEPCALLAGRATELILTKQIIDGVTIACAKENF